MVATVPPPHKSLPRPTRSPNNVYTDVGENYRKPWKKWTSTELEALRIHVLGKNKVEFFGAPISDYTGP